MFHHNVQSWPKQCSACWHVCHTPPHLPFHPWKEMGEGEGEVFSNFELHSLIFFFFFASSSLSGCPCFWEVFTCCQCDSTCMLAHFCVICTEFTLWDSLLPSCVSCSSDPQRETRLWLSAAFPAWAALDISQNRSFSTLKKKRDWVF